MARTSTQWAFDYEDLQKMTGMSSDAVRQAKSRDDFNPDNLRTVVLWLIRNGTVEFKQELASAFFERPGAKKKVVSGKGSAKQLVPSPLEAAPKKKLLKSNRARS